MLASLSAPCRPLKGTNTSPANRYGTTGGPGGTGHSPKIYTNDLNTAAGGYGPAGGSDPYGYGQARADNAFVLGRGFSNSCTSSRT